MGIVTGKEGINAKVILDSISRDNVRITTLELEYPRFIHSELMTHRMLSKNCASSRAIPVERVLEQIEMNPAMPVWWGKNQPGMSAKEELSGDELEQARGDWLYASREAAHTARKLLEAGLHKQISNRVTEPWQRMKTVITGTEWANLLWLRDHEDAQPEFGELAKCITKAFNQSEPRHTFAGSWHLPYVESIPTCDDTFLYYNGPDLISLEDAKKVSASCCAQVSYRRLDDTLEKAKLVYDRLVSASRVHASPFEHQATPMFPSDKLGTPGVTHATEFSFWSGNFRGWIQHRQLIKGHAVW
jgi:hypothetical protein